MKNEFRVKYLNEQREVIEDLIVAAENFNEARIVARAVASENGIKYAFIAVRNGSDRNAYCRELRKHKPDPAYEKKINKTCRLVLPLTADLHEKILAISALTGARRSTAVYTPFKMAIEQLYDSLFYPSGNPRKEIRKKKKPECFLAHVENGEARLHFDDEQKYVNQVYLMLDDKDFKIIKERFEKR